MIRLFRTFEHLPPMTETIATWRLADEMFQPFKRLEQTAEIPGVGLGLVVVKLLTEEMGGRIEVTRDPGRGACFTLVLLRA